MARLAIVTSFSPGLRRRLAAGGRCDAAACVQGPADASPGLPARRFDFKDRPESYLAWRRLVYDWVEALFRQPEIAAGVDQSAGRCGFVPRHLLNALKKGAAIELAEDAKLFVLGERLFAGDERRYLFRWPDLVRLAGVAAPGDDDASAAPLTRAKLAAYAALLTARVLRPAWPERPPKPRFLLFDEAYPSLAENCEILAFYRYLKTRDDVAYNLPAASSDFIPLARADGKPAGAHRWGVPGLQAKAAALRRVHRAARAFELPLALRYWLVKCVGAALRYESLFAAHAPRFYLRVRADTDPFHPIAADVAERHGAETIGYSCGSYPVLDFHYAWIDFHRYGMLGPAFRSVYNGAWPASARYSTLGPYLTELHDPRPRRAGGPLVIAAFSTTTADGFYMQEPIHLAFLDAVCAAARAVGAKILFKEKFADAPEVARFIARAAQGVDYQLIPHVAGGPRSQDVLERADLAAVMGFSSTGWEALALKKKLVVFEQQPWCPHPFENDSVPLVARSKEGFIDSVQRLTAMDQADYERLIEPILRRWCKPSNGRLVRDFIESIEKDHAA